MSCDGLQRINPLCQAAQAAMESTQSAFSSMAHDFGKVAVAATTWLWSQIGTATRIDLSHLGQSKPLMATVTIGLVLCLGLFLLQVLTSALRQEPGGLLRAVRGLVISLMGTGFALGTTVLLLAAVDSLSAGLVRYTMGTNLRALGKRLSLAQLASIQSPVGTLLFSVVILAAVVIVWAALMIRKMMILIAAVLSPLAFAGATADFTRGWVRKWVEFVAAMIASKLLLVIILSVGVSVLDGYGQSGGGVTQTATQLAAGTLILLLGGLAPWVAVKTFHFAGDTLYAAHATAAGGAAGGRALVAAPRKAAAMQLNARALGGGFRMRGAHRPSAVPPDPQEVGSPPPPSPDAPDSGTSNGPSGSPGLPGSGNGSGGSPPLPGGDSSSPKPAAPSTGPDQPPAGAAGGTPTGAGSATSSAGSAASASGAGGGAAAAGGAGAAAAAAPVLIPAALTTGAVKGARGVATATGGAIAKASSPERPTVNDPPSTPPPRPTPNSSPPTSP